MPENPFMQLPDEDSSDNPFMDLPEESTQSGKVLNQLSMREKMNRFSQGMSSHILRGLTVGTSALLPVPGQTKENINQFDIEHPYLGVGAEVAGGVAQGYGLVQGAKAVAPKAMTYLATKVPSWVQLAGLGAAEGTIYGASTAEPGERITGGAFGGGVGAVASPVGGAAIKVGSKIAKGIYSTIKNLLANTPDQQAVRIIKKAIEAENLSPEFIQAELSRLGPEARLVDVSEGLSRTARGAAAIDQQSHSLADSFLNTRQAGQQGRLISSIGGGDFNPAEFSQSFSKWLKGRITNADEFYNKAYDASLKVTPGFKNLMKRPSVKTAMKKANSILVEEGGGSGHVRYFDAVKREIDDKIGVALRKGQKEEARRLINTKRALLEEMDRQVPDYATARNLFSGEASLKSAAEMGYNTVSRSGKDLWIIEDALKAMTESEQYAFRLGSLRGVIDKLDRTAETRNAAQKLIESNRARQVLKMVFPNENSFQRFMQTAEAESTFSRTKNTVLGGSPTARIMEDVKGIEQGVSAGSALLSGHDPVGIAMKFFKLLGIGNPSPETLKVVSNILFSRNVPKKTMQNIISRPSVTDQLGRTGISAGASVAGINALQEPASGR